MNSLVGLDRPRRPDAGPGLGQLRRGLPGCLSPRTDLGPQARLAGRLRTLLRLHVWCFLSSGFNVVAGCLSLHFLPFVHLTMYLIPTPKL